MAPKYLGGKKRDNGLFGFVENGRFCIGWRHVPMTKLERDRFLNRYRKQKGRMLR